MPSMPINEIVMKEAVLDTSLNPTPAEAEAAAAAGKELTVTNDQPDALITQHIAGLSVLDDPKSPAKKKSKKSTTLDGKRKSTKVTPKSATTTTTPNPSSILKSSHTTPSKPPYDHVFKRVIIEASVILNEDAERDRYAEFKHALGIIIGNMILVDSTAEMVPISAQATAPAWTASKHIPSNMTEIGKFVFISSTPWRFRTKSQKRGDNAIYFSFTISSDVPPSEICSGINMEWCRQNGERMAVKTVQNHDTITPILIFFLWNEGPPDLFIQELKTALTQCWEYGIARFDSSLPPTINLPELALVRKFPQVKGTTTPAPPSGAKVNKQLQDSRRVLHIEVGRAHADLLRRLVEIGKGIHVFTTMWGRKIHLSEVLEAKAPNEARMALNKMAQDHSMFIFGSRVERLIGVTMLDWKVATKSTTGEITGKFSLCDILLNHLQTKENKQVIGSIHQCGMDKPFVIVQNSADIESFLGRMNHQLPAFLRFYLKDRNLPEEFVNELLGKSCDVQLFTDSFNCTWDANDQVVTRPDEAVIRARQEEEEKSRQWYKDMVNMHVVLTQPSPPKAHIPPEARFNMDAERSVITINPHKKKKASTTTKAKAKSTGESDSQGDDDDSLDSASTNANGKPFSTVGFEQDKGKTIEIDSSSDSESEGSSEDSSAGSSGAAHDHEGGGKGG